jgi:hypothetical protein
MNDLPYRHQFVLRLPSSVVRMMLTVYKAMRRTRLSFIMHLEKVGCITVDHKCMPNYLIYGETKFHKIQSLSWNHILPTPKGYSTRLGIISRI